MFINTPEELANAVAAAASDKKAQDIVLMKMEGLTIAADYFVVCSANSTTQVRAIADNIEDKLVEAGLNRANISFHSIDDKKYKEFTGSKVNVTDIMNTIRKAKNAGLKIKINSVVIRELV